MKEAEDPAEDPAGDCSSHPDEERGARAKSTHTTALGSPPWPGSGQLPLPEHLPPHPIMSSAHVGLPGQPLSSITAEAGPQQSVSPQNRAGCDQGPPTSHVSPSVRDESHGDKEEGVSKVDTEPR